MKKEIKKEVGKSENFDYEILESSEGNVWKYIFTNDKIVLESVLYQYESFEKRTVICCSVQSGCPVGCTFCGTGKNFLKNLSSDEIIEQVDVVLESKGINKFTNKIEKFQIMFMSMGEPFLNYSSLKATIIKLNEKYPNAELLVSTVGIKNDKNFMDFVNLSKAIDKIGLQFSIHKSTDDERDKLIPYKNKLNLREIRDMGLIWSTATGRNTFLNYCIDETNSSDTDAENLMNLFSPVFFNFTFSVICEADETMQNATCKNLDLINGFKEKFMQEGYNTRVFDPAGQDDIGGGCGQLWKVQEFLKKKKMERNPI